MRIAHFQLTCVIFFMSVAELHVMNMSEKSLPLGILSEHKEKVERGYLEIPLNLGSESNHK
jgi:hypothetical protein